MTKDEYSILSRDEVHTPLHCVRWQPDKGTAAVAVLLIAHGMIEYIERYEGLAAFLCERGFIVCGHDHIGHGESVLDHGDWGKMHTNHPAEVMTEDLLTHYKFLREKYKELPLFLLGHSMGSYVLRRLLAAKSDALGELAGAIIVGTGTESTVSIRAGKLVVRLLIRLRGRDYVSRFVRRLMYGAAYRRFDLTGADASNSWLTKDEAIVRAYHADPKCAFSFSVNGYRALLDLTDYDNAMRHVRRMRKDLPVLFASGTDDPVGNCGEGVRQAFQKFWDAGLTDVGIELYEGDRHEILNETDRATVYEDFYTWMTERMH